MTSLTLVLHHTFFYGAKFLMKILVLVIIIPLPKKVIVNWIAQYLKIFYWSKFLTRMIEIFIIRRVIFVLSVPLSLITVTICVRFHLQPEMASSLSCLAVSEHPLWDWIPWEWSWARTFYPPQPRGGCWRHRSDYPWKTAEKGARNSTQSQLLLLVQYCPGNSK